MLRNNSRAVSSKQSLMADHQISSQSSSSTQKDCNQIPSLFGSPRFRSFKIKGHLDIDALISPTSILDTTKPFPFANPFSYDKNQPPKVGDNIGNFGSSGPLLRNSKFLTKVAPPGNKHSWDKSEPKGIGLALLDKLKDEELEQNTSCKATKVLLGTKLRVQIPPFSTTTIKTLDSHLSRTESANSGIQTDNSSSPQAFVSEMELSEDYTCVISRGANPRTTHIFDNCILDSYCTFSDHSNSASENFLSFCYTCKKNLEQKIDIYIYRGEKAFCSRECRYREMLLDEAGNTEFDCYNTLFLNSSASTGGL